MKTLQRQEILAHLRCCWCKL